MFLTLILWITIFKCFLLIERMFIFKMRILLCAWWLIMLFYLLNYEFNYIVIYKYRTKLAFYWYFLHYCNWESKIYRSSYWVSSSFLHFTQLFKNLNKSDNDILPIRNYILNSFQSADNHTNKTQDCMLKCRLLNIQ